MKDKLPNGQVEHVVVLMLENRGFDHLMGWLYGANENPAILPQSRAGQPFMGLSSMDLSTLGNPTPNGGVLFPNQGARSPKTPTYNTGESFGHIFTQMWGAQANWLDPTTRANTIAQILQEKSAPPMNGYALDYYYDVLENVKLSLSDLQLDDVMDTYVPSQLPVLSGLARYYAVSDEWYCSVPSQTNTNRAFSLSGTSRGMVNNAFYDPPTWNPGVNAFNWLAGSNSDALPVSTRCIFEVLEQANYSWTVFWQDEWPPADFSVGQEWQYTRTMFPLLGDSMFNPNFVKFDYKDPNNPFYTAIQMGILPAVSWIEPKWGGGKRWETVLSGEGKSIRAVGNDYHPVSDTTVGEDFVMGLYNALSSSPSWDKTLLVITFDENGGTYDHAYPPVAPPSGTDACPLPHPKVDRHDMDPNTRTQFGFDFAQYGIRVPTILISPRTPSYTVFRSADPLHPFDHTSLIATILDLAQIPRQNWLLGDRVANAPTFEALVTGDLRPDYDAQSALRVPPPDNTPLGPAVQYNTSYLLQYAGDIWRAKSGKLYLGAADASGPTLTPLASEAAQVQFVGPNGPDQGGPIQNMSTVRIKAVQPAKPGNDVLTVNTLQHTAYYANDPNASGAKWQMRILQSRDTGDTVATSDYVYLVSQLVPNLAQQAYSRVTPDPLQRLIPSISEPGRLTTMAGEWALWKVVPVSSSPDDNV